MMLLLSCEFISFRFLYETTKDGSWINSNLNILSSDRSFPQLVKVGLCRIQLLNSLYKRLCSGGTHERSVQIYFCFPL
jgi:hypothetical protein